MRFHSPLLASLTLMATGLVAAEPDVTMLVPGFSVRELPVRLTNINNLRFAPDGKLTALGYDGRVHLLTDTDGDGLEDTAKPFWAQATLSVPVGMVWSPEGLYVSSHGKVSLLRDTDGDGQADKEEVVASGWPATDVASGGVDATAVTRDAAGNLYFGLLTANYANPYRVKDGVPRYDLHGPRGTIQKMSATTRQLETVATGIRVPYTLAFNRHGDLFVTDQEGETWIPGGNPLDELNHIVSGRNYGFPPRHPTHLPNLISEPPVVAFGPQHQSTCGFVFNEPGGRQGRFGPAWWENDAVVTGQSRGKLWRVRLVKTSDGYVGQPSLIARLRLLTTDVAISPTGDLYVACHSGAPDWGTGPRGAGRLFKISYVEPAAPQPVAAWASGPLELRVAFDRPLDRGIEQEVGAMRIEFGEFVSAADRLEVLQPPYKVVKAQATAARGKLRVAAARVAADARTLVLTTDPHPQATNYALALPGVKAAGGTAASSPIDLAYDLNGLEATWTADAGEDAAPRQWRGWLPHPDLNVSAAFVGESAEHAVLLKALQRSGRLTLRTHVQLPAEQPTLRLRSSSSFKLTVGGRPVAVHREAATFVAEVEPSREDRFELITLEVPTLPGKSLDLVATYSSKTDPTIRVVPLGAWTLPWTTPPAASKPPTGEKTELAGGDFERGRTLFFSSKTQCATCHQIRGEGGTIGPDLSNLVHRDAASVLRDIKDPSATINPDYVAYEIRLRGGETLGGYVRTQNEQELRIAGPDGKDRIVRREDVAELKPSPVSLMPRGLADSLSEGETRHLLTFLLHAPPERTAAEIAAVRRASPPPESGAMKPLTIVLVASKQDHGPRQHDYPAWQKMWKELLSRAAGVTVAEAWNWPTPEQWQTADAVFFNFRNRQWTAERLAQIDAFQARGGGIVAFHAATIIDREPELLAERFGLSAQPGPTKYRHMPVTLKFAAARNQPIVQGFRTLSILDEPYWPMIGDVQRINILATGDVDGSPRPLAWTYERGTGRVFVSIPGHYTWTFEDPLFRRFVLRGCAWACGGPVTRFEHLD